MTTRDWFRVSALLGVVVLAGCAKPEKVPPPPAPPVPASASGTTPSAAGTPSPAGERSQPSRPDKPKGTITQVDLGTLFALQGDGQALVVDVRPAFFYNLDHIPGAISMPLRSFDTLFPAKQPEFDAALEAGKVIVLYCTDEDCPDGEATAREMAARGYSTSVYKGGWKEWKASGL